MADIQITSVKTLTASDLIGNLHEAGETKLKNNGSIRVGSKTYKVSYVSGENGTDRLQMKRHYTGPLGWLLNWAKSGSLATQSTALQLNAKIEELMKSKDYQLARNTYDKLMDIAKTHKGNENGVIEVANYGHSEPRNKITTMAVVEAVNRKLQATKSHKTIQLNKIDTYNTILGITTRSLMPHRYGALMKKIADGNLKLDSKVLNNELYTVEAEDVEKWKAYISDQKILDKIDIPRKLFNYLNQPQGTSEDDAGLVGWKKDFKADPDKALRHFVIKNMPASTMKAGLGNDEAINLMCSKIKDYVAIYSMEDGDEKTAKMAEFLKFENWPCTAEDQADIDDTIKGLINKKAEELRITPEEAQRLHGKAIKEAFYAKQPSRALTTLSSYRLFANVIMYATFRQTSKIGLDFFRSQNKPILFHTSHRNMMDFGDTDWILQEKHWKEGDGQLDQTYGGSEITHSEVRHAYKLIQEYGDNIGGADLWFVKGAQ